MDVHQILHSTLCFVLPLLVVWGAILRYMFDEQTTCAKTGTCPAASVCHRDTDQAHSRVLTVSTLTILILGTVASIFDLHFDWLAVLGVFYASFLVYMTRDIYLWKTSTKQCFARPSNIIQWLPPSSS